MVRQSVTIVNYIAYLICCLIKPVLHFLLQDHRGNQLYLGINHCGILTFQGSRKTHHFRWAEVQKINYEGKMFIVHVTYNEVRNE